MQTAHKIIEEKQDTVSTLEDEEQSDAIEHLSCFGLIFFTRTLEFQQKEHMRKRGNCLPSSVDATIFKDAAAMATLLDDLKAQLVQIQRKQAPVRPFSFFSTLP